ncbi:MAG: hypothetical protein WEB53_07475 [Akkermansiaceae bacterium]
MNKTDPDVVLAMNFFSVNRTMMQENGVRKMGSIKNGVSVQILTDCRELILKKGVLRPLADKRGLDTWEKIVSFTTDGLQSRLSFDVSAVAGRGDVIRDGGVS